MNHPAVERAKEIVAAETWSGDMRVNMTTVIGAGRVLAKRLKEMETLVQKIDTTLRVPAAEYVPAIGDVFQLIDEAFKRKGRRE